MKKKTVLWVAAYNYATDLMKRWKTSSFEGSIESYLRNKINVYEFLDYIYDEDNQTGNSYSVAYENDWFTDEDVEYYVLSSFTKMYSKE